MKKVLCLLCLLVFGLALTACGGSDSESVGNAVEGKLIVGMECDYAPFNWMEETKSDSNVPIANIEGAYAEGYDVQIAKLIAAELNLELVIKSYKWDGLIPALNNNDIDLIIAGMSPTEDRKISIDFTSGYYRSTHVVLVKANSSYESASTLNDFSGAKIAGQINTIYADLVPQMVAKGAKAGTDLDSVPLLVTALKNEVIDGTILEEPVAKGLCEADSSLCYVKLTDGFEVAEEDVMVSIGVRKGYTYTTQINEILESITQEQREAIMLAAVLANSGE